MSTEYNFNPEDFGFEPVKNFPELKNLFPANFFIKVIDIGQKKYLGRVVYWYHCCTKMHDDRWNISSRSYDSNAPFETSPETVRYCGLISNDCFAEILLKHLFGTHSQSSVEEEGAKRLQQNINSQRLD